MLAERSLTAAEKKKKEEIVLALKRDNPDMPKDKMYAIATATAKRVAESNMNESKKLLLGRGLNEDQGDFNLAAAEAAIKGLKNFTFEGKTFPVEMSVIQAREILRSASGRATAAASQAADQAVATTSKMIRGAQNFNVIRRFGGDMLNNFKSVLQNSETRSVILGYMKKAGITGLAISALLAVIIGGRFAWRKFITNPKQRKFARMIATDEGLRRQLTLNYTVTADDLGIKDDSDVKKMIKQVEDLEVKTGVA